MFVDSRSAILGKTKNDENLIEFSGINNVERSLEKFLVQEKGKAKLLNSLLTLKDSNRAVRQIIPPRISMLQADIEVLEERYKKAEEPLKTLETKRQLMTQKVDLKIIDLARTAQDMTEVYTLELMSKITKWSSEYEMKSKIGFPPTKKKIEPVVSEVVNYIRENIEEDIRSWNDSQLTPMIESGLEELKNSLEAQSRDFVKSVELLRIQISIGEHLNNEEIAKQKEVSLVEKAVAVGLGIVAHDWISGGMGAFLGIRGVLNTVILEVIAGVILAILGLLTPPAIVIAVIAAVLGGNYLTLRSLNNGIKKTVGEKFTEELKKHRNEICENVENKVKESLGNVRDVLDAGLAGEISSLRGEVEKVLQEKTSGKLNVEEETKKLRKLEQENNLVEKKLDELFYEAGITGQSISPQPLQTVS
jgi:hypothetical protein